MQLIFYIKRTWKHFYLSFFKMALSKPVVPGANKEFFLQTLDCNEIVNYTTCSITESLSIDVICGYLGGADTTYYCCEEDQSCECYQYCKKELLEMLNDTNLPVIIFEELQTCLMNCLAAVHQKKEKGQREHIILYCLVQMTLTTTPKVGYARNHKFTGKGSNTILFILIFNHDKM